MKKKNISILQYVLTILFVTAFLTSNILAAKQFQLPFGVSMTCGAIVFPITYILSDLFSEVYGYKWSRITCYTAFAANAIMIIFFTIAIKLPAGTYWNSQEAFTTILGATPRMFVASSLGYICGDLLNDKVFKKLKAKHEDMTGFSLRAILSSCAGEMCDSFVFIAIGLIGQMPVTSLITMWIAQVALKLGYEAIILPFTYLLTSRVARFEQVC